MKRSLFILIIVLGSCFLASCRAQRHTHNAATRVQTDEIGVELRRVDSLWSSIAERLSGKIEFYPPTTYNASEPGNWNPESGSPRPTEPTATIIGHASQLGSAGGGIGAVKSIEFTIEHNAQTTATNQVDSTYNSNTASAETLQEEKASEARQDNGTIAIVSVAAAVVILIALFFIIKKLLKK